MTDKKIAIVVRGDVQHLAKQADKHQKEKKHHRHRPCGNPPAMPTGVAFTAQATEARTHLRFTGKLKWNAVTADEQGHGLNIKRYDAQIVACDNTGTPLELEDGFPRMRSHTKVDLTKFGITDVTLVSGTTYEYTLNRNHSFPVGMTLTVDHMKPTGYNGNYAVTNVPSAKKVRMNIGTNPAAATQFGHVYEQADAHYHVIMHELPRPKTWYWKGRVRAIDKDDCAGDWSAWTTPLLPWTGADPEPPTPTYTDPGALTFDRKNRSRHHKLRALFTFNDMAPWDVPGGDHEDDLGHYEVQIDRSDDGAVWDGRPYPHQDVKARRNVGSADADDTNATRTAIFHGGYIQRRYWYRCRVRSFDRFNRPGDWSAWCTPAFPFDDTQPPTPPNVRIFDSATDRVVLDWDDQTIDIPVRGSWSGTIGTPTLTGTVGPKATVEIERGSLVRVGAGGNIYTVKHTGSVPGTPSDTVLTLTGNLSTSPSGAQLFLVVDDPDIAFSEVQIAMSSGVTTGSPDQYNTIYAKDRTRGNRKAFKIIDADRGNTFYGRVRNVDAAFNKSAWVAGKLTANSSTSAGGDGVVIGAGSGKTKVVWSVLGLLRPIPEARTHDYDMDEGLTTIKVRARVKTAPVAAGIVISIYKNAASIGTVTIAAGAKRGVNDALTTTWIDSDILSYSIDSVGSNFAGRHLTVVHVLR